MLSLSSHSLCVVCVCVCVCLCVCLCVCVCCFASSFVLSALVFFCSCGRGFAFVSRLCEEEKRCLINACAANACGARHVCLCLCANVM